jgi:hypothetical protein
MIHFEAFGLILALFGCICSHFSPIQGFVAPIENKKRTYYFSDHQRIDYLNYTLALFTYFICSRFVYIKYM